MVVTLKMFSEAGFFLNFILISLLVLAMGSIENESTLVQVMAWHRWYMYIAGKQCLDDIDNCPRFWTWWHHQMETFSALLAFCAGNSPVIGEFPAQRPVTRSFDVFFDVRLNKRLSKRSWGWWLETPSRPLWLHCNECRNSRRLPGNCVTLTRTNCVRCKKYHVRELYRVRTIRISSVLVQCAAVLTRSILL